MNLPAFVASIKVQADKGLGWEDICVRLKIDAAETQRAVRRIVLEHQDDHDFRARPLHSLRDARARAADI